MSPFLESPLPEGPQPPHLALQQPLPLTLGRRGPLSSRPGRLPPAGRVPASVRGLSHARFLQPLTCGGPALKGPGCWQNFGASAEREARGSEGPALGGGDAASPSRLPARAQLHLASFPSPFLFSHNFTGASGPSAT